MDQLQGMRVFTRVAELGSFARAANTLDLSRAMASSYVAQLEKHLGTRLLHRTTRKVSVSPQGAVYLEHCKRILAEIDAADDQLRLARNRPQGKLRVDVPVAFGKYLLLPAIPQFTQRYPDVSLEVRFNDRYVDIAAEHVDVAVRVGKVHNPDIIAKPHLRLAPADLRLAQVPGAGRHAAHARGPAQASPARPPARRGRRARRTGSSSKATARARCACRMALSFNTVDALTISALEGQGMVQQLDLLVSGYLERRPAGRSAARILLRRPAAQRHLSAAPRSIWPRCACSPSSPPTSCATTKRACAAAPSARELAARRSLSALRCAH